jgi:hypothetical protein
MSYKYSKGSQVIGDLKAADDTQRDTLIDFGEDQIDFQTSGSVRMQINNTGVDVQGDLSVAGEIVGPEGDHLYIKSEQNIYAVLDTDSNNGSYFVVRGNGASSVWLVGEDGRVNHGSSDTPRNSYTLRHDASDGNNGMIIMNNSTTVTTDTLLGAIGFDSNDGLEPSSVLEASAYIAGYAAENHGTSDKGGYLTFGTSKINDDDDTVSTEHMRIESEGVIQASGMPGYILTYRSWSNAANESVTITTGTVQYIDGSTNGKANITFVAPPTGNVELELHVYVEQASAGANLLMALSTDGTSFTTQASSYHRVFDGDETDDGVITVKWVLTGLTSGDSYQYWFGALTTSSNGIILRWGDGGLSSAQYPPLILKATTLPSSIS